MPCEFHGRLGNMRLKWTMKNSSWKATSTANLEVVDNRGEIDSAYNERCQRIIDDYYLFK